MAQCAQVISSSFDPPPRADLYVSRFTLYIGGYLTECDLSTRVALENFLNSHLSELGKIAPFC